MSHKVHQSQSKVPFSWEQKPGVSKATRKEDGHRTYDTDGEYYHIKQLSLPPSQPKVIWGNYVRDVEYDQIKQLPLPPSRPKIIRGNDIHDIEYNKIKQLPLSLPLPLPPSRPKIIRGNDIHDVKYNQIKQLPLPPSRRKITGENQVYDAQRLRLPLPPSGFLSSQISTSRKGHKKQEDPFFTAYRECTKSGNRGKSIGGYRNDRGGLGFSKNMSIFSCKHSCSARDDSMVMLISKNSILSKSQREKRNS